MGHNTDELVLHLIDAGELPLFFDQLPFQADNLAPTLDPGDQFLR
ncbi:MAG: hypothetical protein R2874_09205 [Desulfobacterales bacterium]